MERGGEQCACPCVARPLGGCPTEPPPPGFTCSSRRIHDPLDALYEDPQLGAVWSGQLRYGHMTDWRKETWKLPWVSRLPTTSQQ